MTSDASGGDQDAPAPSPIEARLRALRGSGQMGLSKGDLRRIFRDGDGISLMNQAPKTSSDSIGPLQYMLRRVPTTRRQPTPRLQVGDRAPDFTIVGTHGRVFSLAEFVGRRPIAIRLTRAAGSGVI